MRKHTHTCIHSHTHALGLLFPTVTGGSALALTINILLVLMMLLLPVCQRVSNGCLELKRPHESMTVVEFGANGRKPYPRSIIPDSESYFILY